MLFTLNTAINEHYPSDYIYRETRVSLGVQSVLLATGSEDEEYGIHGRTVINTFTVRTERMAGFVLRDKWCHFFPEFIAECVFR